MEPNNFFETEALEIINSKIDQFITSSLSTLSQQHKDHLKRIREAMESEVRSRYSGSLSNDHEEMLAAFDHAANLNKKV